MAQYPNDNIQYHSVCAPLAQMFALPDSDSPVVSQLVYSWKVLELQEVENFKYVQSEEGYRGWVKSSFLLPYQPFNRSTIQTLSRASHLYEEPDITKKKSVMTLPFESELMVLSEPEQDHFRWIEVQLINDQKAWIQRGDTTKKTPLSSNELVDFSQNFLGLPYTWGGTSSFGYDCSGFIQMLFRQMGVIFPRDAKDQVNASCLVSVNLSDLAPGDLIYCGPEEGKIGHVALYIGENKIIHAAPRPRPLLQIASLSDNTFKQYYSYQLFRRYNKGS
jgi:gamma-D-glutamyl-L-lysine dipeptidyl-peptidase